MIQEISEGFLRGEEPAKTKLVILQPTNFCNIDCKYCYLGDRKSYNLMQPQTVERIAQRLFESPYVRDDIRIVWHAGEPLTVPVSFYRDAVEIFNGSNESDVHVTWGIQTNGTLINREWCDFFKEYNIDVGISIDGPQEFHDRNRVDQRGRGTFNKVMRGIDFLRDNEIGFGILMVIDRYSIGSPEEIWNFFVENKITSVGFNPEEVSGINTQSSLLYDQAQDDMVNFLKALGRLRKQQNRHKIDIREIDDMEAKIKHSQLPVHNALTIPFSILNFDYLGNVSMFSPQLLGQTHSFYGDFRFGNVYKDKLTDILEAPKFKQIFTDIQNGVGLCKETCPYFDICGGGDPSAKLAEHGSFNVSETLECRLHLQASFEAAASMIEEEIANEIKN